MVARLGFGWLPVFVALCLVSCDSMNRVVGTIPPNGATGVDQRTIIAVKLNNSILDTDTSALDPKNFVVTGDLTDGQYEGTLVLATFSKLRRGQTVEEFTREQTSAASEDRKDAIVFLLASGANFKRGEWIRVHVSQRVKAHGSVLKESKNFSFQIAEASDPEGALKVVATDPEPYALGVPNYPEIRVTFSRGAKTDVLPSGIKVRGSQSGMHLEGTTAATKTDAEGALAALRRLKKDDSFLPGETVTVAYTSEIVAGRTGSGSTALTLSPYLLSFQVASGRVAGGWQPLDLGTAIESPIAVLAADFAKDRPGVELAIVGSRSITYLEASPEGVGAWAQTPIQLVDASDPSKVFSVADAVVCDLKGDGSAVIVILLTSAEGSRLLFLERNDSGRLVAIDPSVDFPAGGGKRMLLADLDADGDPELIVTHKAAKSSSYATLFEIKSVAPDPSTINLNDPSSLLPKPRFQPVESTLSKAPFAERIEAADLDGDGILELILETSSGFVFEKLVSLSPGWPYRAKSGRLLGRGGGAFQPLAWAVADFDGDGDADIVAWDAEGPLLFRNPILGEVPPGTAAGASFLSESVSPEPLEASGLPAGLETRAALRALDLDGDASLDLLLVPENEEGSVLRKSSEVPLTFERVGLPAQGPLGPFAIGDLDGDSGLEVASVPQGTAIPRVFFASQVEPPPAEARSSFSFAPEGSGLTDLSGETIRVAVVGDIVKTFSGYSVAIDYDETRLKYLGFESPAIFLRKASFTLCPDASLKGCSGYAAARMAYLQNGKGLPSSNLLLGTFLFQKLAVTEPVSTEIQFVSFSESGGTEYGNTVTVVDGQASYEEEVEVGDSTVTVELEPAAPPDLAATCAVLERGDRALRGRVTWASPSGLVFSSFEVSAAGVPTIALPGSYSSYEFTTEASGLITVTVKGLTPAGTEVVASCVVVGIHRPLVTCESLSRSENVVRWTLTHAADSFLIYRNGVYVATRDSAATQYLDTSPPPGASNYQVAAVLGGIEGPRGSCIGGPVGDQDPAETSPPSNVQASLVSRTQTNSPNELSVRWTNGEGYDEIRVSIVDDFRAETVASVTLAGTDTEYRYSGELSLGGVRPGRYIAQVTGSVRGVSSRTVSSDAVKVPVPALGAAIACGLSESGEIQVSWDPVWQGYSFLQLAVQALADGVPQGDPIVVPLSLKDTSATLSDLAASGSYRVKLLAGYTDPLPPEVVLDPGALERTCAQDINYASRIFVKNVETGVGVEEFSIPIYARAHRPITGFSFELEFPSFLSVDAATALRLDSAGAPLKSLELADGSAPDRRKAIVQVEGASIPADANGDGTVDERDEVLLARIVAGVPADFELPRETPLLFGGQPALDLGGKGLVPVPSSGGKLFVYRRFTRLDEKTVEPGTQEPIELSVRVTFNAPASAPNYRMNAFQLHIVWDTTRLELLPVTEADQADTALAGLGWLVLPTDQTFPVYKASGHLKVSWLGFRLTDPTKPDYLYPGVNQKVLNIKFRSLVPAGSGHAFAAVSFVTDPKDQLPSAFFPEVDVPSEPDMEAFFPGGVRWIPSAGGFSIRSLRPAKGAHAGGAEAVLTGSGLVASGSGTSGVSILFRVEREGGSPLEVPVETILSADPFSIRFRVPPSGIQRPQRLSTLADVEVATPLGRATLARAYSYEYPRASGLDLTSIRASGGELLVIRGEGLAILSQVAFRPEGAAQAVPAEVAGVEADGTRIFVMTPDLRGFEGKRAAVEVTVPGFDTIVVPGTISIRADGTGPELRIDSVSPAEGSICGGDIVTIAGAGFLPGIVVRFGSVEASSVELESGTLLRAATPRVPEGTGRVSVTVSNAAGGSATKPDAFLFKPAGPAFIRGDVTGDGKVNIEDAVALSALVLGRSSAVFPANLDAADANDDGVLNGGDVIFLMNHLFVGGAQPPAPYGEAGWDPTPDGITACTG